MSSATPAPPAPPTKRTMWPSAVRDYVQRTMDEANAIPGIEQQEVHAKLKHLLSVFKGAKEVDNINWAIYPLPQQILAYEKAQAGDDSYLGYNNTFGWANTPVSSITLTTPISSSAVNQINKKKRKSTDGAENSDQTPLNSRNDTNHTTLEERITPRLESKRQKKAKMSVTEHRLKQSKEDIERRKQRFGHVNPDETAAAGYNSVLNEDVTPLGPVVGTCQKLEKNYFRLTSAPKPETVRPQEILEQSLEIVKRKWKLDNQYNYANDQLKSIRQDLTVQHIKNSFTVRVYETHARIALEMADIGEYNQCQTVLRGLYAQKLGGHPDEFLAYRILYFMYTRNQMDMNDLLAELSPGDKAKEPVKHALAVRSSLALGNYHRFFGLYLETPNMGGYLMDMFIQRERLAALASMSKAYPKLKVDFLTKELGFEDDEQFMAFLAQRNLRDYVEVAGPNSRVDLKNAQPRLLSLVQEAFKKVDLKGQI